MSAIRPLLPALLLGALAAGEPVRVAIEGVGLSLNGVDSVPRGLFGVHNAPLTEAQAAEWGIDSVRVINRSPGKPMVADGIVTTVGADGKPRSSGYPASIGPFVECLYDRYQPALQLTRADWRNHLAALGRSYGEQTRATGKHHLIEFWNEPYLNWATQPGVSYLGSWYDESAAEAGKPMSLKVTGEVAPGLVWDRRIFAAIVPSNGQIDAVSTGRIPREGKAGQTVKLRYSSQSITLEEGATVVFPNFGPRILRQVWIGKDTEQKHYWSGPYNRQLYIEMYRAFAEALKQADPQVEVAAGWGINLFNEGWDTWHLLYRPTIDALHPWMDGLHEHHYGGDTRVVAASYEVAYAYALGKHGKRLRFWNTEAGGHLDPEQPGNAKSANEGTPLLRATAAMTYLLRDVIHLIARCPDKAYTRAAHHPQENGGDFIAFQMLKPLRGRLLQTTSSAQDLWTVASLADDRLVVALFNDRREARQINLAVQAPTGRRLAGAQRLGHRTATRTKADGTNEDILAFRQDVLPIAPGAAWQGRIDIGGTAATVIVFDLEGSGRQLPLSAWTQHVSGEVLLTAAPGVPAATSIAIPGAALRAASAARLRLVVSPPVSRLRCSFNGAPIELPDDGAWIVDVPLGRDRLTEQNALQFTTAGDSPVTIASASLWLQHP